jgi:hypothetical protein
MSDNLKGEDYRMVHSTVKKVAQELAGAYYEFAAGHSKHGNKFYETWPNQDKFIKNQWPNYVYYAKQVMVEMLTNPATPEAYKNEIHNALTNDAMLPYSHQETQVVNFRH